MRLSIIGILSITSYEIFYHLITERNSSLKFFKQISYFNIVNLFYCNTKNIYQYISITFH